MRTASAILLAAFLVCGAIGGTRADAQLINGYDQQVAVAKQSMLDRPELAAQAARRAAALAGTDQGARSQALWLEAEALLRLNRADEAKPRIDRALGLRAATGESGTLRGDMLLTRAGVHAEIGKVGLALEDYQQAYKVFESSGDRRKQAIALSTLASVYRQGSDYRTALKYYREANDIYSGDPVFTVSVFNNRGSVLQDSGDAKGAIAEFRQALALAEQLENPRWKAQILANLARSQLASGDVAGARQSVDQGFSIVGGSVGPALDELRTVAALVALEAGDLPRAVEYVDAEFSGVDLGATTLQSRAAHRAAYMVYSRAGRAVDALAHLEALRRLDEQATQIATSTRAALMSARFDFANQELRIANLKAEELRRNVDFERSRTRLQQTIFAIAALGTLMVLALLGYNLFTTRRSRNEIRAANTQLAATNVRLEKALAAKTEFLATTSHEIRTPLNGILGMTQVMLADGSVSGKVKDRIGIVHGAGLTMKALVDDILDVAKMETGHLSVSLEPTDLPATLGEVTRMWEEQAHAKGLAFVLDLSRAPRWIETDPGRLRQIVFNLLANALKFTETGGITIGVMAREGDDPRLVIQVRDTGIGIPAHLQSDIFESFKQADSGTTRRFGGTGLGLAICRNLCRALGGDISVKSAPDEGSTFIVDLPLRAVAPPEGMANAAQGSALLIVDRNPINRAMLRTLLESRAGEVRFASNIDEAEDMLARGGISHMLIDDGSVRVGDDDPFALVGRFAAAAAQSGAVSALLWKTPSDEDHSHLRETAIDLVIAKPVAGGALADALFGAKANPPLVSQAA